MVACLRSVLRQSYSDYEVVVVDNASTDGRIELIKRLFPMVRFIANSKNMGYAEGNNVGIRLSDSEYVVVLNYDTEVHERWLEELIRPLTLDKAIALSTSKILLYGERETINACGNVEHYTGLAFCRGLGEDEVNMGNPCS